MHRIERIILIDDNEVTNFINRDLLLSMNPEWCVEDHTDPMKALDHITAIAEQLKKENVLILLDIKMPECTGFDLLRELEELDAGLENILICMLTSSNLARDREEMLKFPMITQYIEKPLDREKIASLFGLFQQKAEA